jgi:hypothetical protein
MTKKLEFVGNADMKRKAILTLASRLRYGTLARPIKKLLNSAGMEPLRELSLLIYNEYRRECRSWGVVIKKDEGVKTSFTGYTERGCKIFLPYYPKAPRVVEIELWRNKEVLSISVNDEDAEKFFYWILYTLGHEVKVLTEPIEISGTVLRLGHWVSALTCKAMGDQASFQMYHDQGIDEGIAPVPAPKTLSREELFTELLKNISSNGTKQILISIRNKLPNMPVPSFEHNTFTWRDVAKMQKDYLDFPDYQLMDKGVWKRVTEEDFVFVLTDLWG